MKRIKLIILLSAILIAFLSVSCSNEETIEEQDERFIGLWELDEVLCHVNTSDEYFQEILETAIIKDDLLNGTIFQDTIQFNKEGYFFETGYLATEEVWNSRADFYPTYKVVNGEELFIGDVDWGIPVNNRRATYEFVGQDMLVLTIEYVDENDTLRLRLQLSGEYGNRVGDLQIKHVRYTQIYRKISDSPYGLE